MKALRRDPHERYASVERFSADLRYFLDARPVKARRELGGRLAGAALRRNWPAIGMAASLLILLSCLAMQAMQLRQEREDAQLIAMLTQRVFSQTDSGIALGGAYGPRHGVLQAVMPSEQGSRVPLVSSVAAALRSLDASMHDLPSPMTDQDRREATATDGSHGGALQAIVCVAQRNQLALRGQSNQAQDIAKNVCDPTQQCPGLHAMPTWLERLGDADRRASTAAAGPEPAMVAVGGVLRWDESLRSGMLSGGLA
jgi:hypothetical protein